MKKLITILIALILILLAFAYLLRYDLETGGQGACYKLDRWTGEVTVLLGTREKIVKPPE